MMGKNNDSFTSRGTAIKTDALENEEAREVKRQAKTANDVLRGFQRAKARGKSAASEASSCFVPKSARAPLPRPPRPPKAAASTDGSTIRGNVCDTQRENAGDGRQ